MSESDVQTLEKIQSELMRSLSRLSYVGMGIDKALDQALSALRQSIKKEASAEAIKQHVDKISNILVSIEDQHAQGKIEVAGFQADISDLIRDRKLPVSLTAQLTGNSQEKNEGVTIARSMIDLILDYIERLSAHSEQANLGNAQQTALQFEGLTEQDDQSRVEPIKNQTPHKKGFWQRLWGFFTQPDAPVTQQAPAANKDFSSDQLLLSGELQASLRVLVNQLSSLSTYSEVANQLTEKINHLNSVDKLVDMLELITNAFVQIASREHQQLETFLKSLTKRLERMSGFVKKAVTFGQKVSQQSKALDKSLQGNVTDIRKSFSGTDNFEEIKVAVLGKMDEIEATVTAFRSAQVENEQQLLTDVEKLKEQLRVTQDESSRLRDELEEQKARAQTDQLTQLPNRYSYHERLTQEYNRWRRYRGQLTLVIADIDFFKKINDQYGHEAGDLVLKNVAKYLFDTLRESDFIARYGGEEFVILLPETGLVDATKAMNKIRLGIKKQKVNYQGKSISIAMSFGISEFDNGDTTKAVFERADTALYRAKEKGRDQVCCQRAKK